MAITPSSRDSERLDSGLYQASSEKKRFERLQIDRSKPTVILLTVALRLVSIPIGKDWKKHHAQNLISFFHSRKTVACTVRPACLLPCVIGAIHKLVAI